MPSVTIGMPVYNGAEYLDMALESLCKQTYMDLEILISDNASTDETPNIIKKWADKDPRISHYRHPETVSMELNFGSVIEKASGQWFCYAAHDDLWSPNYIEELVKPLQKRPDAVISVPHRIMIDNDSSHKASKAYSDAPEDASLKTIIKHNLDIVQSAWYYALFNKTEFLKLQKSRSLFLQTWGADFAIYIPLVLSNKIVGSDKAVFYQRDTGISGKLYAPKGSKALFEHYRDFWKEMLFHLEQVELTQIEKLLLLPALAKYARNVVKPKTIAKTFLREIFTPNSPKLK
ncbi:MAG: glycosyltransferase family 2 protein [Sneathiellales bacterium]|nr:glycosyltransferase family 2 protein [Sneathiellales bacterium]